MKRIILIMAALIAISRGEIEEVEPSSKLTSSAKELSDNKDLEASASDRTFLIGKDNGYGGYGSGYGNYPWLGGTSVYNPSGSGYYNRGNGLNTVYRGYQSGYGGVLGGGNTGWGYYGTGGSGGLGGYGTSGLGYGAYDDGRGYNRWNSVDGGYGGYGGYNGYGNTIGYGSYGGVGYGASTYPYGYRGTGYSGYPSGYRGYS